MIVPGRNDGSKDDELLQFVIVLIRAAKSILAFGDGWVARRKGRFAQPDQK